MFENGKIMHRQRIINREDIRVPPGYKKRFQVRQCSFTLETFDRMRVLLTELRMVLNAGHWLTVRLSPKIQLGRNILERTLKWV